MSKRVKIVCYLVLLVFFQPAFNNIVAQQYTEYEVKAGYIYNFVRFISWPEGSFTNSTSPIVIGIYGSDRFGEIIRRTIRTNTVDGRSFVIKYYNHPSQIQQCHLLFVSEISRTELIDLLRVVRKKPILTVGDNLDDFCQMGGIINFTPQHSRNRFEINNTTARNNEINISSKLLSLAKIVTINEVEF